MTDATPLTPEEEAALRADVAASRGTVRGWHAGAAARLLATLDAERAAASQGDERLRARIERLADLWSRDDTAEWVDFVPRLSRTGVVQALRAALAAEEERHG